EPNLAALPRGRALARLDRGDLPPAELEAALADLETAAGLEPPESRRGADDHARRGRLLLRLERPGEALAAADSALALAPGFATAHVVRVDALLALERYGDAIASCDAALAHGPATTSAEMHRLRGLGRVGRRDFSGAIEDYTLALALHPDNAAEIH